MKKRLLVYFYTRPGEERYLRELAEILHADPANLSRDLKKLEKEGVFKSQMRGNLKFFSLDAGYPLYEEMRTSVAKLTPHQSNPPLSMEKTCAAVYVIAGPNGAGKTTFAKTFLPDFLDCKVFVNADLIAGGIAPLAPEQAAIKAGKLLLEEIRETAKRKVDFGFETTLSGRSYVNLFNEFIRQGYAVHLVFLWLPNIDISIKRIAERVKRGGHHIPEQVARRRFARGVENLFKLYDSMLSGWVIFDNSAAEPAMLAYREGERKVILDETKFSQIQKIAGLL